MYIFLSYVYWSHCDIVIKEDSNKIVLTRKYLKNSSSSFPFWEMQIKTSLRFHLTPLRMAKVNKPAGTTYLLKRGGSEKPIGCWQECKLKKPLWWSVWRILSGKWGPAAQLPGIHQKDFRIDFTDTCWVVFIAALFTTLGIEQRERPSAHEWIIKLWCLYTREHYSAAKENEVMNFAATWM